MLVYTVLYIIFLINCNPFISVWRDNIYLRMVIWRNLFTVRPTEGKTKWNQNFTFPIFNWDILQIKFY